MQPHTGVLPGLKVMVDRAKRWKFAWQQSPLAASPQEVYGPTSEYLAGLIKKYDAVILSRREYQQNFPMPQLIFMPAIDPFSIKNRELTEAEMNDRLEE